MATSEAIKARLEAERDRLKNDIQSQGNQLPLYDGSPTESHASNHSADQASDTFEEEKALAIKAQLQSQLDDVERALIKQGEGRYGACEECGNNIPAERLEALPAARLCIQCKTRAEAPRIG